LKAKNAEMFCPSEDAPAEFYAAKDRGEVKPGTSFEIWWSKKQAKLELKESLS
jgi:hypothetical protein